MIKHAFIAIAALLLTACLVRIDSDTRALQTGWSEADVQRIEPGVSDRQWLVDTFGDPVSRISHADGTEIWTYRNRSEKDMEVGLFLILSVDVEQERIETLSIELTDGLVTEYRITEERF